MGLPDHDINALGCGGYFINFEYIILPHNDNAPKQANNWALDLPKEIQLLNQVLMLYHPSSKRTSIASMCILTISAQYLLNSLLLAPLAFQMMKFINNLGCDGDFLFMHFAFPFAALASRLSCTGLVCLVSRIRTGFSLIAESLEFGFEANLGLPRTVSCSLSIVR